MELIKDTFEEYLGKKDHISASDVKAFLKSPKYYYHNKYLAEKKSKDFFDLGTAIHEIIMEPHLFDSHFSIHPKFDKRTKKGKEDYELFAKANEGKILLDEEQYSMISNIRDNALKNKTLQRFIEDSYKEVSIYTVDEKTGLKIRLRPDMLCKSMSTIVDIKSTQSAHPSSFKRSVFSFGYDITDQFYTKFSKRENYVFCAAEKDEPNQVVLYELDYDLKMNVDEKIDRALGLMKWSYDNDYWCDYNEFEILKECYDCGEVNDFFSTLDRSNTISFLY